MSAGDEAARRLPWAAWQARFAPARDRWLALSERDRRMLRLALAVLGAYLVWLVGVQPALRTLETAPAQRDALDAQWQQMQRLAVEARELRAAPPVDATQAAAALKAATDRLGDKGRLSMQGERAVLTLTGVGTSQLRDWLAEARAGARARPIELRLTRSGAGYNGALVVAIGAPR